jgi:hypothetical protein
LAPHSTLIVVSIAAALMGCRNEEPRLTVEAKPVAQSMGSLENQAPLGLSLASVTWTQPTDWQSEVGKGMRLATLTRPNWPQITITALPAQGVMAGGQRANVQRWMRQAKVALATDELEKFLSQPDTFSTQKSWPCSHYDFTKSADPKGLSVTQCVAGAYVLFVKTMGPLDSVQAMTPMLLSIARSLSAPAPLVLSPEGSAPSAMGAAHP